MIILFITIIVSFVLIYKNVSFEKVLLVFIFGIGLSLTIPMDYEVVEHKYILHHHKPFAESTTAYIHYEDYIRPIVMDNKRLKIYTCDGYSKSYFFAYKKVASKHWVNLFAIDYDYYNDEYILELKTN